MQEEFLELSARAREEGSVFQKKRFFYQRVAKHAGERVFVAVIGPRGAGKTIMLRQLLSETPASFYLSLDSEKPEGGLFGLAKELCDNKGVKLLLLDEVHSLPGFDGELKKIHDFLGGKLNVVFTSSSSLSLHESSFDLSRRVRVLRAPPFSFKEFLFFEKNALLPPLSLQDLLSEAKAREYCGKALHWESLFNPFLQGRNYPFTLGKTDFLPLFRNILETVLNKDIVLAGRATPEEAMEMRKTLAFMGNSPAEDMSYSSIAKNVGLTKYKAEKFVDLLEKAFVLKRVFPKGSNVLKEPKILFSPPYRLLYKSFKECVGALREDFFAEAMDAAGLEVNYLKTKRGEKTPDYAFGKTVFEIGGVSKSTEQFKGFSAEKKIILTHPGALDKTRRPLFLAGMLDAPA